VASVPSFHDLTQAGANAWDLFLGRGVADLRHMPRSIIHEGDQRTVYRYRVTRQTRKDPGPILLVPPLAAPATCFDLRRGCSLAEHLVGRGHAGYLVDYGAISFSDRDLGLEHWVEDVIPASIQAVSEDAGGRPVHVVGWCLGGIMSLLAVARGEQPVATVSLIASPFDFAQMRLMAPIRMLSELTGGALGTALYRALGGAPARLVTRGFQLTAIERYLTKPLETARHLHDRDWLAHMEAVDDYMRNMLAYPGRTFGQLYHQFFRVNDLADGRIELRGHTIDVADVTQPVLVVAGEGDILAPAPAVRPVLDLLTGSTDVRFELAPGGHLGVLTGHSAVRTTWAHLDRFLTDHAGSAAPAIAG
jgi:polyhydroxyalkanoate synthase